MSRTLTLPALLLALVPAPLPAAGARGFGLSVLVDGSEVPEYRSGATTYVEALRGREYALRITNPLPVRVGVALSVDGLSTVDARRSDPASATKWILEPYQSIVVAGWQVSSTTARQFYFTGERQSYAAQLGQTENLGVIEAVFFREKERRRPLTFWPKREGERDEARPRSDAPAEPAPPAAKGSASGAAPRPQEALSDDYAATGMGERNRHDVERVDVELESRPSASVRIRYEFRAQLVKLGVLPRWGVGPLERRELSRGFDGAYCPEPRPDR